MEMMYLWYDMKHKEVNYTNNYIAFLVDEIKWWQKLQISFSFGLRGRLARIFFPLAHCAWIFFSTFAVQEFFLVISQPPLKNIMAQR